MREALKIRVASLGEKESLEALQRRASLVHETYRELLLENPDAISLPHRQLEAGLVFVAERAGQTAGFAALYIRDDGDIDLDGMFVEPSYWRQGIGAALITHCKNIGKLRGAKRICVIANPDALSFYEAGGFAIDGVAETRFGPAHAMSAAL